jgi:hypothetical protein
VLLESPEFDYVLDVVDIFQIKVLKMGHPLPVLPIVDNILNYVRNSLLDYDFH